jgi:hypothetical protein
MVRSPFILLFGKRMRLGVHFTGLVEVSELCDEETRHHTRQLSVSYFCLSKYAQGETVKTGATQSPYFVVCAVITAKKKANPSCKMLPQCMAMRSKSGGGG